MTTPIDTLVATLKEAASYNPAAESPPEAVVWCDANRDFIPLLPTLRERLPQLLTYGDFDSATRTGPAVWLRAVAVGAVETVLLPEDCTPIIYVPDVERETLKGEDNCPSVLQPLVWLTVAGNFFVHTNGKDWTLQGFLTDKRGGLNLKIAEDEETCTALKDAAVKFCLRPTKELRNKSWDADQLSALLVPDLDADMLDWIDSTFTEAEDAGRFTAFANIAKKNLKFDPRKLTCQDAVRRLVLREGEWANVWFRFTESTTGYSNVIKFLHLEEPNTLFPPLENRDSYPQLNTTEEQNLRDELSTLADLSCEDAKKKIEALEKEHAWRQETVWAKRGEAPLAQALRNLVIVAKAKSLPAQDGKSLADAYAKEGCNIDWAAMCALSAASREIDCQAVAVALRSLYLPWVEEGALALQELVRTGKVKLASPPKSKPTATTILFVDGFRMDLAKELVRLLDREGLNSKLDWTWSGFPTVTATCKPIVSPVASFLKGPEKTSDFLPANSKGKLATQPVLLKLIQAEGWETENPLLLDANLWAETGKFDEEGHALGIGIAGRIKVGICNVVDVLVRLVHMGRNIRIVTDHGWLLMPGGLPKAELDSGLLELKGKRTRCALVKPKAQTSYLQVSWSWNNAITIAAATGARSFYASCDYAHGGISPQECVLPVLEISSEIKSRDVSISKAHWEGLRLRVEVANGADWHVDLRLGRETSGPTLIKGDRVLDENGRTSFLVRDIYERQQVCLVVLDDDSRILAHRILTVGDK